LLTVYSIVSWESATVRQHLRFLCWPSTVQHYRLFAEVHTKVPSTANFLIMQCLLQTCCIGSYYLCHWRYMTPEWTLYQRQNNEEPYHQANESSSKNDNYFKASNRKHHSRRTRSLRKRSSEHGIRDETCQDVRNLPAQQPREYDSPRT
jgi:hypothetical protein